MKTGRMYLQFLGLATMAILLFGVFRARPCRPAGKKRRYLPEGNSSICLESTLARPVMKSCTKRTSRIQRISKLRCMTGHGCESCHGPGSAHVEGGGDVDQDH